MNAPDDPVPVYIDQNILSHLREGQNTKEELARLMSALQEKNAVLVYSMTHVVECRASSRPEQFVAVMEDLPVYFMEFQNASDLQSTLSLGRAREMLLEPEGTPHLARQLIEELLHVFQFARGWLSEADVKNMKTEMAAEMEEYWETTRREIDWDGLGAKLREQAKHTLSKAQSEMGELIESMPFEQVQDEWEKGWIRLKDRLPVNYAQLDEISDEEAVSFVVSCFEEREREGVRNRFPKGFWGLTEDRNTGELAGLAFLLFMCGLVRDRRVRKGSKEKRMQYFRGQYRDCVHIENATRCAMLITHDKGMARLARSIYAYAGVETKVVELRKKDAVAR